MRRQWKHFITFLLKSTDFFFFLRRLISHLHTIMMLSCKIWHLAQMIQKDNEEYERVLRQWGLEKQSDMKFHVIPHLQDMLEITRGKCYGDKEIGANLKRWWGNVITHKQGQHAAGDCQPKQDGGLWFRRGQHCTFSPSVSCTALGSAARLARPLAWAIWRYMDV